MYSNVILKVFNNPQNAGRIMKPDGIATTYNENETENVEFSIRVESGIITDCKFRAQANPYIVAICSTITEMVKGKMVAMLFLDARSIKEKLLDDSDYNIDFCINCVKDAIANYKENLEKENKGRKVAELKTDFDTNIDTDISTNVEDIIDLDFDSDSDEE